MRWFVNRPGITVAFFVAWKIALLLFTVQPIPSNDAYFYDGAVVNSLGGGAFVNPTVAIARPYSGTEFFSAYPPLYQAVLLGWMNIFGTSARSAVGLHVVLTAAWALLVYLILRRLEIPAWMMQLAAGFLFAITFHDRPDSLAHVLGAGAVLAMAGWMRRSQTNGPLWGSWLLLSLTFCASLQLGATYAGVVGVTVLAHSWLGKQRLPWVPLGVMGVTPLMLLAVGKFGIPRWWTGFIENAQDNPSAPGLHLPEVDAVLKLIRSLPGFLGIMLLVVWCLPRMRSQWRELKVPQLAFFLGTTAGTLAVCALGLCYMTANYIPAFAGYLQPLAIGAGLAWLTAAKRLCIPRAVVIGGGCLCIAIGGIRAVGMTTWGVLCARDVSYEESCRIVASELRASSGSTSRPVVASAAYLYAAAGQTNLKLIHSDYMVRPQGRATKSDLEGLIALKPGRLLLTQFDYYRRYEAVVAQFRREHGEVEVHITNAARVQAPDAERATRKLIQHISWAPVVVEFSWPQTGESK